MTELPLSEVLGVTPVWEGGSLAEASLTAAWGVVREGGVQENKLPSMSVGVTPFCRSEAMVSPTDSVSAWSVVNQWCYVTEGLTSICIGASGHQLDVSHLHHFWVRCLFVWTDCL